VSASEPARGRGSRWAFVLPLVISLVLGLAACGGGGAVGTVSPQPLSGLIDGQPWTFVAGETNHFLSVDRFFATLFDQMIDSPCLGGDPTGATRSLILNIPMAVGRYALSLDLNQTFSFKDASGTYQNDAATSGVLEVTTLTATTILGGVKMAFDGRNTVDGQFEIAICAQ
jgi:hypothetical protein